MIEYVLGFLFSKDCRTVVLMQKTHPDWQAGKLNGVGGQCKPGELAQEAMEREFREEAGLRVESWRYFARMTGGGYDGKSWVCWCFTTTSELDRVQTMEEEPIMMFPTDRPLPDNALPNLRWLIPLALDTERKQVEVNYR